MSWIWIVVIAVVVLLVLYLVGTYNTLVKLRNRVKDGWAQIEVVLKRRADLIPNLVETLTEAYPDLKANTNFMDLQNNLKETEDKISFGRQFYNDTVLKYKNKIEMFPSNIVAGMFGFKSEPFFEASEADREVPKVQF